MKRNTIILLYSATTDLLVSVMKFFGGIISHSGALISDATYTFSNFITDIMALIGTKLSKKRPNKSHPFGFGRVEYLASIFMGIIIFLIGIFMLTFSFQEKELFPQMTTIVIVIIAILLKIIASIFLFREGKREKNQLLLENAKIATVDIQSTFFVLLTIFLAFFFESNPLFPLLDIIISLFICFHIFQLSYRILKENMIAIIGTTENDNKLMHMIESDIKKIKGVEFVTVALIKYGIYYKAEVIVRIDENLTIRKFINVEKKIKKKLKNKKYHIRYVTIQIDDEKK